MIPTIVLLVKYFEKTKWVLDTVEAFSGFFFFFFFAIFSFYWLRNCKVSNDYKYRCLSFY